MYLESEAKNIKHKISKNCSFFRTLASIIAGVRNTPV